MIERFEADHFELARSSRRDSRVVVVGDHVVPPRLPDVAFQLDAQRAVIPEAVQTAVDLAGLKDESAPFAERNDLIHRLGHGSPQDRVGRASRDPPVKQFQKGGSPDGCPHSTLIERIEDVARHPCKAGYSRGAIRICFGSAGTPLAGVIRREATSNSGTIRNKSQRAARSMSASRPNEIRLRPP